MFLLELLKQSTFFPSIQNDVFLNSLSRLKHPEKFVWSPALNFVEFGYENCIRLWTAWKDEFHQNGQQLTISNRNHFDFCRRNKSQAVFTYICLFNPWIFCHLPNESWVWKRKLYLWLQKKTLTCFWVSRVVKKKRGVTVSTFFQILRCFHHLRTSTKKGMEKNTASWDPCRSQLSLLPWQRVMRPYGSLIAVGGFPERCRGLRLKHRWF